MKKRVKVRCAQCGRELLKQDVVDTRTDQPGNRRRVWGKCCRGAHSKEVGKVGVDG